jgi:hypothetical protein
MPNQSIPMSDEMRAEIEQRRAKGEQIIPVSQYVREAIRYRFRAEDCGEFGVDETVADAPADD